MSEGYIQAILIVGSNLLMMLTFFGISISMHNQSRNEMMEMRKETNEIVRSIQEDVRDFHYRLAKIEEDKNKAKHD